MTVFRRVRMDLAYDGTDFAGWQVQPGRRTVQGILEQALSRIEGGGSVRVRGAGRTDAGAHARAQVADAEVQCRLDDDGLARALRSLLPRDLRPWSVRTVPATFHPRYGAVSKTYRYAIDRTPAGDPFLARYADHRAGRLDREAMQEALSLLPGTKDWSGFTAAACEVNHRVRTLTEARYDEPTPGLGVFTFAADGFLTFMVRNLVGTVLDIARGRFPPRHMAEVLASGDRVLAGPTAPSRGLVLDRVIYQSECTAECDGPPLPWNGLPDGPHG